MSYNFTSGPWKTLWVKLGYDPRSTTASKVYQCIDYRMPKDITMIETRRSRQKFKAGIHEHRSKKPETWRTCTN